MLKAGLNFAKKIINPAAAATKEAANCSARVASKAGKAATDTIRLSAHREQFINSTLHNSEFLQSTLGRSRYQGFLKETGGDYELLNRVFGNKELVESPNLLQSILYNTNKNNRIILDTYLKNGIKCITKNKNGEYIEKTISKESLNILINLNRNNTNVAQLISSPAQVGNFLNGVIQTGKNITAKGGSLNNTMCGLIYGSINSGKTPVVLSRNLLDDFENISHGLPYYKKFTNTDTQTILSKVQMGEAFSINGKMHIKESESLLTPLHYDEKVFEKLFPAIDRFNTCQGGVGDCYFVSVLNSLMRTPKGRNEIYKMFSKSTMDRILIKSVRSPHYYRVRNFDKEGKHIRNENGLAMIEQYFAVCEQTGGLRQPVPEDVSHLMKSFGKGGQQYYIAKRLIPIPNENINQFFETEQELINYLRKNHNNPNKIVCFGTIDKPRSAAESALQIKYDLLSKHGYSITGYNDAQRSVLISNPHNCGVETEIPISELMKYKLNERVGMFGLNLA